MENNTKKSYDVLSIALSMIIVLFVVTCLYLMPEKSQEVANSIFALLTDLFGSPVLLFTFFGLLALVFVCVSKFGNIKLGEGEPEYSTFRWVAMMISCGLGSATVYWAFIEWAYYIGTPGLGIEPGSQLAYEMSVPYTMFHWGFSAWALYAIIGLPIAYHFHVRKNTSLSLSGVVSAVTGIKPDGIISRIIDILFIFICFGALSITLGVSTPLVTNVLSAVIGIEPTFMTNVFIIIVLSVIYSFSSYIGLKKGMSRLSDWNVRLMFLFILGIAIGGPTLFIIENVTNSFGLMLSNFIDMSLYTDPIGGGSFPESWTIFYWLYWITYAPFTGVFIAKVSKARTVRAVIVNTLASGSLGTFLFFGVLGSLSVHHQINGTIDMVAMLNAGQDNAAIVEVLKALPGGALFMIVFCVSTLMFLATTLDGSAYTMASTTTKGLHNNEEPNPALRLFWCVMLSLVPLTMIFIDANLNTIKTCAIITAIPIVFIMVTIFAGWFKWMYQDYGKKSVETIIHESENS